MTPKCTSSTNSTATESKLTSERKKKKKILRRAATLLVFGLMVISFNFVLENISIAAHVAHKIQKNIVRHNINGWIQREKKKKSNKQK